MHAPLRIVVTGLAVTYPFGGVFWDYVQYLLGFKRLGHDVLYIEDTGKWCYSPNSSTFVERGDENVKHFATQLNKLDSDLCNRWFFRDVGGNCFGLAWNEVAEFCRTADLFLHISASSILREEYLRAKTVAFIDSDPMYTQVGFMGHESDGDATLSWWKKHHDIFFTFGENIGNPDCKVPTIDISWIPTRQPLVLDHFAPLSVAGSSRRRMITTVASWEPTQDGPVHNGIQYTGKSTEFLRFIDLPSRCPVPIEIALSGSAPKHELVQAGWKIIDAYSISYDPWIYRDYLANSFAEWSVAKNAYAASRSGWFSCRSACYLALGVPVIVQDTGFDSAIPTGDGILKFLSIEEASQAIIEVCENYSRHEIAATEIAREYFDSTSVLMTLLDNCQAG